MFLLESKGSLENQTEVLLRTNNNFVVFYLRVIFFFTVHVVLYMSKYFYHLLHDNCLTLNTCS